MNALVYNGQPSELQWAWEANALRTGLLLCNESLSVGQAPYMILHEQMSRDLAPKYRIKFMLTYNEDEQLNALLKQDLATLQQMSRIKHPNKQQIVARKRLEHSLDDVFDAVVKLSLIKVGRFGMPQLAPFYDPEVGPLHLWVVQNAGGEVDKEGLLSNILSFNTSIHPTPAPLLFILYDRLAKETLEAHDLFHLATLPNLNGLTTAQIDNARRMLSPQRDELGALLPLTPPGGDGEAYCTGVWNMDGLFALKPKLQEAIDAVPELVTVREQYSDFRTELHVGSMDVIQLWQLLQDNAMLPEDTWRVLDALRRSGVHCPNIPIMTITSEWTEDPLPDFTEEESLKHRRKTIDLN